MSIWAIADLHLSFGVPNKEMHVFGENWRNHPDTIKKHWEEKISEDDLVLIAGDISWAKHIEDAVPDLEWIGSLPGTKVMIRGNHDYWWAAISKVRCILPPSVHVIQNDSFTWHDVTVGGARLWDDHELGFDDCVQMVDIECVKTLTEKDVDPERAEKVYVRELLRLEKSLSSLNPMAETRIAMVHYPPVDIHLNGSRASRMLEEFKIDYCVFGHIHSMKHVKQQMFGEKNGVKYIMTAADYINFNPVKLL